MIATCLALKWSRILGTAASASVEKKWGWEATEEAILAKAQHTSRSPRFFVSENCVLGKKIGKEKGKLTNWDCGYHLYTRLEQPWNIMWTIGIGVDTDHGEISRMVCELWLDMAWTYDHGRLQSDCGLGLKPLDHVGFPWGYPNSWLVYKSKILWKLDDLGVPFSWTPLYVSPSGLVVNGLPTSWSSQILRNQAPFDHWPIQKSSPNRYQKHGSLNVPIEHHPTIRYIVYKCL